MNKRWYPVAFSAAVVGCGGETFSSGAGTGGSSSIDGGTPTSTGGFYGVAYGVMRPSGGNASIDSGAPSTVGGTAATLYGIIIPGTGGAHVIFTVPQGGSTSINTGTPSTTGGRSIVYIYGAISVVPSAGDQRQ